MAEIGVATHELLLDDNRMAQTAGGVFEFENTETSIPVINAQERNALYAKFGVDVAGQGVSLNAVVLNDRVVPGDDCFWNRGIGRCAIDQWCFGFEREAQSNVS